MLHELGYEVIDEPQAEPEEVNSLDYVEEYAPSVPDQVAAPMPARGYDAYDNDAPLPSYDLEEIGPADVSNAYSDPAIPAARAAQRREPSARPHQGLSQQGSRSQSAQARSGIGCCAQISAVSSTRLASTVFMVLRFREGHHHGAKSG